MEKIGLIEKCKRDLVLVKIESLGSEANSGTRLWAKNLAGAKIGDKVLVDLSEKNFAQANLFFYLIPLGALVSSVGLGKWISVQKNLRALLEAKLGAIFTALLLEGDNLSLLLGILALILAFFVVRGLVQRDLRTKVVRILE